MVGPERKQTILIVEDDDDSRELMDAYFEDAGYHVLCATSAEEALRVLDAEAGVDLLLTDYNFPGSNGGSLIRRARNLGLVNADTPVLMCTAHCYAHAPPNVTLLHKPIDPYVLLGIVEKALARRDGGAVA